MSKPSYVTPKPSTEQPLQCIGQVFLDRRYGQTIPTWFTNHLAVPTHAQIRDFINRIESFYAAHTDAEILEFNRIEEKKWHEEITAPIPAKPRIPKPGYVYLMSSSQGHYKIGYSIDPDNRHRMLSIELPFSIAIVCVIKTDDMKALEKELHNRFSDKRLSGEWFALVTADVEYIQSLAVQK